jgi:hypothetical protein
MFIFISAINMMVVYEGVFQGKVELSDEGGFIENTTAFGFLFAGVLLTFQSLSKVGIELRLNQIFAVTCVVLFLREVDVEDLNVPDMLKFFGSGLGRNVLFVLAYAFIVVSILIKEREGLLRKIVISFKSPVSKIVLIGCACLLVGSLFERNHNVLAEEIMEMNGSLLILLASITYLKNPIYSECLN